MRTEFEKLPDVARNGKPRIVYGYGISDSLTSIGGKHLPEYKVWKSMIRRCYSENRGNISDNYLDCSVSDEFKFFSKFKIWCAEQKGFNSDGWELDKDLLVKGNKVYSPSTCCYLPREVNSALITQKRRRGSLPIGVYLNKRSGGYMARMNLGKGIRNLGTYSNASDAFLVYKKYKEDFLKELANKYRDLISNEAYSALLSYSVEFDD